MKVQNYPNAQSDQFLESLFEMIPPKTTSCFGCRKNIGTFQFQPQMTLYEENRGLIVVGKAQKPMHKDSSGALHYTPGLPNACFHVNERCIRLIFPYFNGRMLECYKFATRTNNFYHNSNFFI